ncbi:putative holin-like toxin [Paenibacillus alkalitolerans]|uniref:putative holin-like toxin n=1 Tax=Paenibacillus alkalitolerans TaxID=2799335 RepID=UPI0018F3228D
MEVENAFGIMIGFSTFVIALLTTFVRSPLHQRSRWGMNDDFPEHPRRGWAGETASSI